MNYFMFVGSYAKETEEGIFVFQFDGEKGTGRLIATRSGIRNPTYLSVSDNMVYAVSETPEGETGSIRSYRFDADKGRLHFVNELSSGGASTCYIELDVSGRYGLVSNYYGGSISLFAVDESGYLRNTAQFIQYEGKGFLPGRQDGPHIHQSVFTPDRKRVLMCDLGRDRVLVYRFDPAVKQPLFLEKELKSDPGSGPRHLVFHPSLPYLYLFHEMNPVIHVIGYDGSEFTTVQVVENWQNGKQGQDGAAIKISPDGRFLYASCRGDQNEIGVYSINQSDGKLINLGFISVEGSGPRDFEIDPAGNFLVVTNQWSGNIVIFKVDKASGSISKSDEFALRSPVFVTFLKL